MLSLILIISLSSCRKNNEKSVMAQYDKGQYLNMSLDNEPGTLDQSKAVDVYSSQVLAEVNEALTRVEMDEKGKNIVKPAGAEKWDISSDGLKWTFHLRDNSWSDGIKVVARDYEYSIKRTLDPKVASQNVFLLYPIKGAREYSDIEKNKNGKIKSDTVGVKALDDKTLEITLESPCAYFLSLTSSNVMQPQRKDIVDKYGDKYALNPGEMVFCGPFKIKQWIHNNKIELAKNESYWDFKSVKLQKVTMKIIKSDIDVASELQAGNLDEGKIVSSELKDKLDKENKFDAIKVSKASTNYEIYNQKDKLFSNLKIRKAFSVALDREGISKNLWKSIYTPAYAFVPPSIQIGNEDFRQKSNFEPIKKLKEDNTNPKALFIEGLKEVGIEQDPSKITISYLQPNMDTNQKEIAEFLKQMYVKELGVNIKLEYVDWDQFQKKIGNGEYQISTMTWSADYNDPMAEFPIWMTGVNMIYTGWSNSQYDNLIKKASLLGSDKNEERFKCFKEAENILLLEDAVISPTVYRNKQIYKYKYVKGLIYPLFGPEVELKYAYTQGRNE
ncbi:peptide ABC transporter substrate-binding protein [Clostridiaceae bacterium UIB06]|nr:peptide ABC transporter substrate-binding protein [Clostridiaceae bacterium UIB06]